MKRLAKPDVCRLTAHIRGDAYGVRPVEIAPEATDVLKAWHLRKADGTGYYVADTIHGATCECASYVFRHEGKDQVGCKHIRALRAMGLLERPDGAPHTWPSWTDTHAYATR